MSRDPDRHGVDVGDWAPGDRTGREPDPWDDRPSAAELAEDAAELEAFTRRWWRERGVS